eukprot:XP_019926009.1 PREDICTED: uncharacterized protein LOC105336023 isoform X2 [Crassostrea gigas]
MENSSCTCFPFVKCKVDTECYFGCISVQYRDDCDLINSISIPLAVIAVLIICICIVAIIRMRCACRDCNTCRPRTAANADSQMTNLSFDTFDLKEQAPISIDTFLSRNKVIFRHLMNQLCRDQTKLFRQLILYLRLPRPQTRIQVKM